MHRYLDTPTPARRASRSGARGLSLTTGAAVIALAIAACGSSTKASSTTRTTTPAPISTPTTTTPTATTAAKKTHPAHAKAAAHPRKTTTTTHTQASTTTHPTTTTTHTTSAPKPKPAPPAFVKPMKATLVGENHAPIATKLWPYTVTATDANGKALSGRVDVEFTFNGTVVGHATPPTDPLTDGRWHDNLTFPPAAVGEPIVLQVVVHTSLGTMTLDWPVKVKK